MIADLIDSVLKLCLFSYLGFRLFFWWFAKLEKAEVDSLNARIQEREQREKREADAIRRHQERKHKLR